MMNRLIFLLFVAVLVGYLGQRPAAVASEQRSSAARYDCPWNYLINGNFEQGASGWLVQPNTGPLADKNLIDKHPIIYDGLYSAKLGGEEGSGDDSRDTIQQLVTIPDHAVLTYQWLMETYEPQPDYQDFMGVGLMAPSEYPYWIIDSHGITGVQDTWQQATIDLSQYAGQRLNLRFSVYNDGHFYSTFYVDAVCLFGTQDQYRYLPLVMR